ncbi:GNAT family N-acetyltransferase [Marinomonas sp. 42_23_T18]|nr:GNAT family N-acetyltransferase [Marinomonas sp. 42_23_T18]
MSFQLETKRLILRDFKQEDQAAYQAFTSDKKYQKFYSEEDCLPDKALSLVEQFVSESKLTNRQNYNLAIIDKDTLKVIGVCGIRIQADLQASVGCGLSRDYQRKGVAQEAIECLFDFAFNQLKLHRLYAETISQNKAAITLCKSVGMREEALFVENRYFKQTWWNTTVLAILRSEWLSTEPY